LQSDKAERQNRLIFEKSPYLLQHAHNPVDWHPWGDEAFSKAKKDQKPVFLSIGYSSCHWCQVMEAESFEDQEVADLLNEHFVSIKVDREERPDIDHIYMVVCQSMTGSGGWPLTIIMTPEKKPFFAGTYFPKQAKLGRPGLMEILSQTAGLWENQRERLLDAGEQVADMVGSFSSAAQPGQLTASNIEEVYLLLQSSFDGRYGGFGQAPKFPGAHNLSFLLRWWKRSGEENALEMVEKTLDAMWRGGMHDKVGFGFHRYSTDALWLVPHFEKMLYNQALLARAYLKGWQLSGKSQFIRVAKGTLDYVLRDMTSPEGGFYSATDADSEGREGTFFLWSDKQIKQVLSPRQEKLAMAVFGITRSGNFEGSNILAIAEPWEVVAKSLGLGVKQLWKELDDLLRILRKVREERVHPYRDEKIVTAWNGMMISTLAYAADVLNDSRYREAAISAAEFIWENNRKTTGELWRTHLHGNSSIEASQEDYAYYAEALLQLYDITGERLWLERAIEITDEMIRQFMDQESGGFYMSRNEGPGSLGRMKESSDNAIPSGNSVALRVLQKLSIRTPEQKYSKMANALLQEFSPAIDKHPRSYSYMLLATNALLNGEIGAHQYAGMGNIAIHGTARKMSGDSIIVILKVSIQNGWHINSDRPLQEELIATCLQLGNETTGWNLKRVTYPEPVNRKLGFLRDEMSLYEGDVEIVAELVNDATSSSTSLPINLQLQTCSDKVCLAPETVSLNISHVNLDN
jgi:uncharacterized protein YyaL (SSP411 family)